MNHYEIINEFNEEVKCDYLPKIIDKCLEMEHVENAVFTIIPASRLSTPSFVCRIAVTNPDVTPAAMAAASILFFIYILSFYLF